MQWTRRAPAPSNHPLLNDELRDGKEMKVQRQFRTESPRWLFFFFFWVSVLFLLLLLQMQSVKATGYNTCRRPTPSIGDYRRLLQPVKILEIFFVILSYIFSYFMLYFFNFKLIVSKNV